MTVTPKSLSAPSFSSLNYAEITLEFVESGEYKFPTGLINTASLSQALATTFMGKSFSTFMSSFDPTNFSDTVQGILGKQLSSTLKNLNIQNLFEIGDGIADLVSDVSVLIEGGADVIGQRILDSLGISSYVSSVSNWASVASNLTDLCRSGALTETVKDAVGYSANTLATAAQAHAAVQALVRQTFVADLIMASSVVGTELDRVSESTAATVMAYDDLISIRDDVLEVIDAEMLLCGSDDIYQVLEQARSAVYQDMTERAEGKAKLVEFALASVMPALVLAYDYYGDASRDSEIIERNKVANGGFVPATTLKLLNE
jgi:prophage DNA circulation protein